MLGCGRRCRQTYRARPDRTLGCSNDDCHHRKGRVVTNGYITFTPGLGPLEVAMISARHHVLTSPARTPSLVMSTRLTMEIHRHRRALSGTAPGYCTWKTGTGRPACAHERGAPFSPPTPTMLTTAAPCRCGQSAWCSMSLPTAEPKPAMHHDHWSPAGNGAQHDAQQLDKRRPLLEDRRAAFQLEPVTPSPATAPHRVR